MTEPWELLFFPCRLGYIKMIFVEFLWKIKKACDVCYFTFSPWVDLEHQ